MKKNTLTLIFALFSIFTFASIPDVMEFTIIDEIEFSQFDQNRVQLENPFGSSEILNPDAAAELNGFEIKSVSLVFTTYRDAESFDQQKLNEDRIKVLMDLIPELKNDNSIQWKFIGVDRYKTRFPATKQFHGFIVEYEAPFLHYTQIEQQEWSINTNHDEEIICQNGTKIHIPANSFVDLNGNDIQGQVDLKVREGLNTMDMIVGNLTTMTDKQEILQTGGMIEVNVSVNGKELKLKEGKSLDLEIPDNDGLDNMQQWQMDWNNGQMTWTRPQTLTTPKINLSVSNRTALEERKLKLYGAEVGVWKCRHNNYNSEYDKIRQTIIKGFLLKVEMINEQDTIVFDDESYDCNVGLDAGLTEYQATIVERWFEFNETDHALAASLWQNYWIFESEKEYLGEREKTKEEVLKETKKQTVRNVQLTNLGWCNIDRLARFPNASLVKLEVKCPNNKDMDSYQAQLIIPGLNVCIGGQLDKRDKLNFGYYRDYNIMCPKGEEAYILMMGYEGENTYYSLKKIVLGEDTFVVSKLENEDPDEIVSLIEKNINI